MNLMVDTRVWSLALRRSPPSDAAGVDLLKRCLDRGDLVVTTGLMLQELLQGFRGPAAKKRIIRDFSLLPLISPDIEDHIEAAHLRNRCRRKAVQIGTIDALIARLCIHHELSLLTTDRDFTNMARYCGLEVVDVRQA